MESAKNVYIPYMKLTAGWTNQGGKQGLYPKIISPLIIPHRHTVLRVNNSQHPKHLQQISENRTDIL